ncbi:MAG TPA: NUDIX hydrolase [Rhabdochlamydiaceae bacterium]|nr:NUDIX hydrolase [Rhabdochlamydiaceae bacterium]
MKEEKSQIQYQREKNAKTTSELIYRGKIVSIRKDIFKVGDGLPQQYDIVLHPGAVGIVPVSQQGNLLLVKQWRRAAQKILLEIPAGTLDENEDPLECAQRELQEETGFKAETFISLGGFYTAPGFCTEYLHLFIAKDLSPSPLPPDDDELIDVVEMEPHQALDMIYEHQIEDAKTIAGILQYHQWQSHESRKKAKK